MVTPDLIPHTARLAKRWLDNNCLILDTETTGFQRYDRVIELAIINASGDVLFDSLIYSDTPSSAEALAIHGISGQMLQGAPRLKDVYQQLLSITAGKLLVAYNAGFDARLLQQSIQPRGELHDRLDNMYCAMHLYAHFYGEWDHARENYKWQKLGNAAQQQGVVVDGQAHRALTDCFTTLGVLRAMAKHAEDV